MDTRGKTNAEFRNEVNEAFARHESNFDQVHATPQTILAKLQGLRVSRSPHLHQQEINHFSQGESSNTIHKPQTQPLKFSFPKFNGEDPNGWIYKAKQYFDFQSIPIDQRVQLASFHLKGIALNGTIG